MGWAPFCVAHATGEFEQQFSRFSVCVPNAGAHIYEFADRSGLDVPRRNVHRIAFINGHGGNPDVIRAVQRDLAARDGLFTCMIGTVSCASAEARGVWENRSDHAGEEETSQVMFLRPELVREDRIADNPPQHPKLKTLREFPVDFVRRGTCTCPPLLAATREKPRPKKAKRSSIQPWKARRGCCSTCHRRKIQRHFPIDFRGVCNATDSHHNTRGIAMIDAHLHLTHSTRSVAETIAHIETIGAEKAVNLAD